MSRALHTLITALLPLACAVRLTEVTVAQESVLLHLTATAPYSTGSRRSAPSPAAQATRCPGPR
jgi:hypothetical protein